MYKLIVRRIVRRTFARLSKGEYEPIVKQFRPQSRFMFAGEHALGGERAARRPCGSGSRRCCGASRGSRSCRGRSS